MNRKRYCSIQATSLEEILETCDRHIRNITCYQHDLIDNQDGTSNDRFYINMFHDTWADLRDDVAKMLQSTAFADILACFRSGRISAAQFIKHLQDPLFAAWFEKQRSDE
jgi:hypothetical protein